MKSTLIPLSLVCTGLGLFVQAAAATTISYVGTETGAATNDFNVQNWSNPTVPKTYDVGGTEKYGTAGYYQIRSIPYPADTNQVYEAVGDGNDLGTSATTYPTLYSAPSFLSSITGFSGTWVCFGSYSIFRGTNGADLYNQGGLSVPVNLGPFNSPAGTNASQAGTPIQFTLGTSASFRLGLAVDTVVNGTYAPDYVSVYNANLDPNTVFSGALNRDGWSPDMVFFDITGNSGDTFIVGLWQNTNTPPSVAVLGLVTFDLLPTIQPTLSYTNSGGNLTLSWPLEVTGWTLEGSTNLSVANSWNPVPGVVSNSVSVPMTSSLEFFRLKQN
jgi:hypothetical protein